MALRLEGQLSLDGSGFERGINSAIGSVKELVLSAVGFTTVTASFLKAAAAAKEFAEGVKDGSDRMGASASTFQQYAYSAAKSGTEIETFQSALDRLANAQEDAKNGNEKTRAAFEQFGVSITDLVTKKPYEIFDMIGESVEKTGANSKVTAGLIDIVGRGAGKLIPMLKELRESKGEAPIVSDEDLKKVDDAGKAVNSLGFNLKSMATTLGAQFAAPTDFLSKLLFQGDVADQVAGINKMRETLLRQKAYSGKMLISPEMSAEDAAMRDFVGSKLSAVEKKDKAEALAIEKKITEEIQKRNLAGMSPEQRRLELTKQIAFQEAEIQRMKFEGASDSELSGMRLGVEQSKTALAGIRVSSPVKSDSLTSVGNFLGASGNTIQNIAQKQLTIATLHQKQSEKFNTMFVEYMNFIKNKPTLGFPFN